MNSLRIEELEYTEPQEMEIPYCRGSTADQPTAAKRHTEQDSRPDLYPKTNHSHTGEARPHQCERVVANICPVQKKTKKIDLSTTTNNKEKLPQYRDLFETEIKFLSVFIWATGQNGITEKTKTVRKREPSLLPLHKLYTLSRLRFTPERNVHHSRADFFDLKREDGETAADVWKRILEVEKN